MITSKKRISEKATKKIDIILPVAQKGISYDIYCGNTLILSQNLTANKTSDMELKLQKPTTPLLPLRTNKTRKYEGFKCNIYTTIFLLYVSGIFIENYLARKVNQRHIEDKQI